MDELVEKLCTVLAEHALDGDGPAGDAMRDALQKSGVADFVKDAERYRWLRERHDMTHQDWHVRDPFNNPPEIGDLDAAIDAAMNGANEH